ncbi:Cupredoxin [Xylariomycetidae sp. FL2044]|nr:Cupredoxin [Xylariomycetidae sp. FL2044]
METGFRSMHWTYFAILVVVLASACGVWAEIVTYDWEVTWVYGAPDGFLRPLVAINGQWPCPIIEASAGDIVVINLLNSLGNETTGLHFHGVSQISSNFMDGASGTSQCPLAPGLSITYSFVADQAGTYWYHSHNMGQYPDGLRGPLIIHDPDDPYLYDYDEDVILTVSDWYHQQTPTLMRDTLQPSNKNFLPPRPDSIIVNEGTDGHIPVEVGKTYRLRMISFSALTAVFISFGSLDMDVIAIDANYVKKQPVNQLRIAPAERYTVLITASDENIPYLVALDLNQDFTSKAPIQPIAFLNNVTGMLVVDPNLDMTQSVVVPAPFRPFDDSTLQPYNDEAALGPVTKQWVLNFDYCRDVNDYPRACFNGTTFIGQHVPTLYSAVSLGELNTATLAYGQVNAFTVGYGEVLEIVINNHDAAIHPFHLHGHQFQVVSRPPSESGDWVPVPVSTGKKEEEEEDRSPPPPRRDTVTVYAHSHVVLRVWHVEMGLVATLIEAPERLLSGVTIPQDHRDACEFLGIPTEGNAAGNLDSADTSGFVTVPPTTYTG